MGKGAGWSGQGIVFANSVGAVCGGSAEATCTGAGAGFARGVGAAAGFAMLATVTDLGAAFATVAVVSTSSAGSFLPKPKSLASGLSGSRCAVVTPLLRAAASETEEG